MKIFFEKEKNISQIHQDPTTFIFHHKFRNNSMLELLCGSERERREREERGDTLERKAVDRLLLDYASLL